MIPQVRPEEVDHLASLDVPPRVHTLHLLPVFLGACARAPPAVQARQLERRLSIVAENLDAVAEGRALRNVVHVG